MMKDLALVITIILSIRAVARVKNVSGGLKASGFLEVDDMAVFWSLFGESAFV